MHAASVENPVGRGKVIATCRSSSHSFSKSLQPSITLLAGLGVDGDAHLGVTVKHRSRGQSHKVIPFKQIFGAIQGYGQRLIALP